MPDLRPLRVAQTTSQLISAGHIKEQPSWLPTVARIPPSSDISRKLPPSFHANKPQKNGKARRVFRLERINYPEDKLRQRFYKEHPWELARPVLLIEQDGNDAARYNWSKIEQPGKQISGESVIQRQIHLMKHASPKMSKESAYTAACEEFYKVRQFEAIEKRIAMEEAMAFGATFNKTQTEIGLELEAAIVEAWREKALQAKNLVQPITSNDILSVTQKARKNEDFEVETTETGEVIAGENLDERT